MLPKLDMKINVIKPLALSSPTHEVKRTLVANSIHMSEVDLRDEEIDNICQGLSQNAAKIRYLEKMGLKVRQKPNGRPLVNRRHYDKVTSHSTFQSVLSEPRWSSN